MEISRDAYIHTKKKKEKRKIKKPFDCLFVATCLNFTISGIKKEKTSKNPFSMIS